MKVLKNIQSKRAGKENKTPYNFCQCFKIIFQIKITITEQGYILYELKKWLRDVPNFLLTLLSFIHKYVGILVTFHSYQSDPTFTELWLLNFSWHIAIWLLKDKKKINCQTTQLLQ